MKEQEVSVENYDFKRQMKHNIKSLLLPKLNSYGFMKLGANRYIREANGLIQIILFNIEKDRLRVFATYYPIFVPYDDLLNYGVEITGSTGIDLLGGKYFTTLFEKGESKEEQVKNYYEKVLPSLNKIVSAILEGVIPEMEANNSLISFLRKFDSEDILFFGHKFDARFTEHPVHQYIFQVHNCLYCDFRDGIENLKRIKDTLNENELKEYIERLLWKQEGKITKTQFMINLESIVEERRKKYKLPPSNTLIRI